MDILEYFDNTYESSVELEQLANQGKFRVIIVIDDLLKLANEKLSDEINWILDCI